MIDVGMASKIINYYRMPQEGDLVRSTSAPTAVAVASVGEDDEEGGITGENLPGTSSSSAAAGSGVTATAEGGGEQATGRAATTTARVPRHVRLLRQASATGGRYGGGISSVDIPKLPEGITEVLNPQDKFPFLGDISPGAPPQPALISNLYRAPLFMQAPKPVDFLLVRVPHKRDEHHFIVRRFTSVFTAGQQEPLMIVPKPNRKKLSPLQMNFLTMHLTRFFSTSMRGK